MSFSVQKYTSQQKSEWDAFIAGAKNATFLFMRDFMDYHSDRFEDYSLMVYKGDKLFAVLPANKQGTAIHSHQGLTYGSFVLQPSATLIASNEAFGALLAFLSSEGITTLHLKLIPPFYNSIPSDELAYFLYKTNAKLVKRDVSMVIDYAHQLPFKKNRREGVNKSKRNGIEIKIDNNFDEFWNDVLIPNLKGKHGVTPVHSLEEIKRLANNFPENIIQVSAYHEGKMVAGTTVFLTKTTVHPQYVSGNADKNSFGSLDALYHFVINHFSEGRRYFDFNISSEENGTVLNQGLLFWKETCGARTYIVDNYSIDTASYENLKLTTK